MNMHMFQMNGKNIVLDVNSGAVHVVDEIVWDIIKLYEDKSLELIIDDLKNKYDESDIVEAYKEIQTLVDNELLFTKEEELDINYNPQNIVKALCLHVAHDCNLKCEYCFASQGDFKGQRLLMPLEVGKRALEFLVENSGNRKNLEVDFFGGEPLMNFDVVTREHYIFSLIHAHT